MDLVEVFYVGGCGKLGTVRANLAASVKDSTKKAAFGTKIK